MQAPPRWTKLRPPPPPRPPYLVASAWVSGLPVSVNPAVLQLFCGSHHPRDQAHAPPPAAQPRPDPACSGQRSAPLSRPPHPAWDTHGLQSLQGGESAGGWSPPWPALSARGPRTGGWAFLSPHRPRTGVPRAHLGAVGTRSLPPLCLEGIPGLRTGQGSTSGLQVALWWGLPATRPGRFSCSGLGLGPSHHVHSPTQLFIH